MMDSPDWGTSLLRVQIFRRRVERMSSQVRWVLNTDISASTTAFSKLRPLFESRIGYFPATPLGSAAGILESVRAKR
jgi:hypothetical protein